MKNLIFRSLVSCSIIIVLLFAGGTVHCQMVAVTGTYVGNGQVGHNIPGLGFKPDFLLIKCDLYYGQIATTTFPVNRAKDLNGGILSAGLVTSITNDGFILGNDVKVNKSGTTYNYLAIKADTSKFVLGSYIGNGTDNRDIVATGFKPDMVIIISADNNEKPIYSSSTMETDRSMDFLNAGLIADHVQAFNNNGFQVGKDKSVNVAGLTYHYIAMKHTPGFIHIGSYTGDGVSNRVITQPGGGIFTMVKMTGQHALFRTKDMPLNKTHYFKNSASVSDRIISNLTNGFQIGANNEVNQLSNVYHYMQINGFSNVLPVTWLSFNVASMQESVKLEWKTAFTDENASFEVERSANGIDFSPLATVVSQTSSGPETGGSYTDVNPLPGTSYYRIRYVATNGNAGYSDLKPVTRNKQTELSFRVYPNPFSSNTISVESNLAPASFSVDVFNAMGTKMTTVNMTGSSKVLELPANLPPGLYYLTGRAGNHEIFRKTISKAR